MKCILFIADAVRPDYLSCYGNPTINTATIDELAEKGVRFEWVISSAPWTAPSTASIVSGVYAHKHQIFTWDRGFGNNVYTLFQTLADHGHAVGSFVFDQNYLFSKMPFAGVQGNTDQYDQVCDWIKYHAHQDFFLVIHSWATHMPYNVHHTARQEWKAAKELFIHRLQTGGREAVEESKAAYCRAIEYTNSYQIATLMNLLQDRGIFSETLVIFMADHGESWGERFANKEEIQGIHHLHGRFLYDETIRVPLILHWPDHLPGSRVVNVQVRSIDLAPTIPDLAGLKLPPTAMQSIDGTSLLPVIEGTNEENRPAFSATSEYGQLSKISLRTPQYKYIYNVDKSETELYNLYQDPGEQVNLVDQQLAIGQRIRTKIEAELANVELIELTQVEEARLLDRLEELGYL